jgi:YD repeat-containing protein
LVTTDPETQYTKNPLNITHETRYEPTTGQVVETRAPAGLDGSSPHDEQTIYYTVEANPTDPECGEHREWAGLTCLTRPAAQPKHEKVVVPTLPEVRTVAYNLYDQPEVIEEVFKTEKAPGEVKTTTRTKVEEYDAAGRAKASRTTSSAPESEAKALPAVTYGYDESTGAQVAESAGGVTTEGVFNTLGQMTEYKDGTGNTTHLAYDELTGELKELTDSAPVGGEGAHERFAYNETSGSLIRLEDSQAGTFTAAYNGAGQMTSELYPDGVCALYEYNAVEAPTHLEYVKSSGCKPATDVWYSESIHSSVHGEVLADENTLQSTQVSYDAAGRTEQTQETLPGKGCTVELFAYDTPESDRIKQTKRGPEQGGGCASSGGEEQSHTYDEGNRLADEGVEYNSLGDITTTPAADAGGNVLLTSYYVDGQVASQSQHGHANAYVYGPAGRVDATVSESEGAAKKTMISQYDGPGQTVAWTCEGSAGHCEGATFTRNIPGVDGALSAVDESGKSTS